MGIRARARSAAKPVSAGEFLSPRRVASGIYNHSFSMLDTQSHRMQCVNEFSESAANADVFSDGQTFVVSPPSVHLSPQRFRTVATRTNHELQANEKHAARPVQKNTEIRSKYCSEVYKVDKYYIGLLRELPPPSAVQDRWDREVRPSLEEHLRRATSLLPKSIPDEETITEPVLCMAGKKCSPSSIVLGPGATCPKDPVALKPTIWIFCGGRKCKKRVKATVQNLAYLNRFLADFCMDSPYASLHAPWPAAGESSSDSLHSQESFRKISFAIQCPASGWTTICGAKARFTIQTPDDIVERYSTVGGLISVDGSLFGLTSAHAVVNHLLESSGSTSTDEIESIDSCSSESGPDCETSSNSGSEISSGDPCPSQLRTASTSRPFLQSHPIHDVEEGMWVDFELPMILAYMGKGTIGGDYHFPDLAPSTSDFALINLGNFATLPNGFRDPFHETVTDVSDLILTSELISGEVWIISTCYDKPLKGYLLESDASIILRGTVMRTRKIQVAFANASGLSGSWVIREGRLCGSIYAAYDRSPYLHMLPAESMFEDIQSLLGTDNIRVATARDIRLQRDHTRRSKMAENSVDQPSQEGRAPSDLSSLSSMSATSIQPTSQDSSVEEPNAHQKRPVLPGASDTDSNATPGPIPATTPLVVRQDQNGVQWIAFEYSRDRVKMEYTIRCDIESVDVTDLSADFKTENCVYPRACCQKDQYKGNRLHYETECNTVGWALAHLNPCLRGKRGLIQRAVDSWRNSNQDPRLRSRRVRRMAKINNRKVNQQQQHGGSIVGSNTSLGSLQLSNPYQTFGEGQGAQDGFNGSVHDGLGHHLPLPHATSFSFPEAK